YRVLIRRLLAGPPSAVVFGTFGLLVFLQGAAQYLFTSDFRSVPNPPFQGTLHLGEAQLVAGFGALLLTALVFAFVEYTEPGRALRALSEDRVAAQLMGIDMQRMIALASGLGIACVGAAGALLMLTYQAYPRVGTEFALTAFVVVALGGFGSVPGALVGAVLVGLVEVLGGFYISPALKMVPVYVLYLLV